ncbi:hypothetical protein HY838_01220 [Candidatus Azambacteria bacterium]|nr:hypothetical protein [Candidatus Azambacteria bacterium]
MYQTIKKFLAEGGKCLLIEDDKPIGVILTMEEYELLQSKPETKNSKQEKNLFSEIDNKFAGADAPAKTTPAPAANPIGEMMAREMDYPEASADLSDIESADLNLEDLGIDERLY